MCCDAYFAYTYIDNIGHVCLAMLHLTLSLLDIRSKGFTNHRAVLDPLW